MKDFDARFKIILVFWSFWIRYEKEILEKITKTVSTPTELSCLLELPRIRKRDSSADYWDEGTRLQRGTRRLAQIPERTKNEGKQVGWQTNRLGFYAVSFNFLDQSPLLSKKQSCRIFRIYKSFRFPHLSKPMNFANVISKVIAVVTENGTIELYATFNVICLTCNNWAK